MISFTLRPRPPFRLDLAVWTLRRRPENIVDWWDGVQYQRAVGTACGPVLLHLRQPGSGGAARLCVEVHGDGTPTQLRRLATTSIERLLGIRVDLSDFYRFAARHPKLGLLAARFRGMKPPRFLTGFECLANAVACQQISLAAGIQLLNRFAQTFGVSIENKGVQQHAFPRPEDLVHATVEDLAGIGFSRQKAASLLELAEEMRSGQFDLHASRRLSDEAVVDALCRLRGIGRWSAEYAMLRGLGRLHVFPGDDVGGQNNLRAWLQLPQSLDYAGVERTLRRWRPYRGLVYFHLLLDKLATAGHVEPTA